MRVIEQFYVVSVLPAPQNPLHPTRWPVLGAPVRQDGTPVASSEDGTPAPLQQTNLQTGISGTSRHVDGGEGDFRNLSSFTPDPSAEMDFCDIMRNYCIGNNS